MLEWLLAPIDAGRAHEVGPLLAWHARLMVAAWAVCIPLGILAARFFKIMPGQDWPRVLDATPWWHAHRGLQYLGGGLMLAALALIWQAGGVGRSSAAHGLCAWAALALGLVQYLGGWLRGSKGGPTDPAPDGSWRGDHYDMTRRRIVFEVIHKSAGYLALAAAMAAIATGLWRANAPVWMVLVIALWWLALAVAFVMLQRRGLAVDTYQAIWGPGAEHPGHALRPIGLGITRRAGKPPRA